MGTIFKTHDEAKRYIEDFEKENFVQLWVAHSRTIEGARKRGFSRHIRQELKYTEIIYRCIHGGNRKESRSTGIRPNQSSYRQGCPFLLKLKAATDGESLEMVDFINEHNHDHSKETSTYLPKFRALDAPTRELTKHMLHVEANKKLIQAELHVTTNQNVTLKDLHNLAAASKDSNDTLERTLSYLKEKDDCIVEVVKNESNHLQGIFFQDREMKRIFNCYPQILFVDAIHKISNHSMPLYILLVEDGNGESEIVAFYLVTSEDEATMRKLGTIFKQHNPSWVNVKSIMTDKDFEERKIFHEEFPNAKLLICLFHCLRTFRREITTEKMGITTGEREMCLKLIQKLVYACNEEDYNQVYLELKETELSPVIEYFDKNWHPIREQWVVSLQHCATVTYNNTINNRLESINSKVTQIVKRFSDLHSLFVGLDKLLISLRIQQDNRAAQVLLRTPMNMPATSVDESHYRKYLTPYAYGYVSKRFQKKNKVSVVDVNDETYIVSSNSGRHNYATESNCSCSFFITMELPCEHILKVREVKGIDLFCEGLVALRWKRNYYFSNSRLSFSTSSTSETTILTSSVQSSRILSQHEKFRVAALKVQKIASLVSETSSKIYEQRMKVLNDLIQMWESNTEVILSVAGADCSCKEVNKSQRQVRDSELNSAQFFQSGSVDDDDFLPDPTFTNEEVMDTDAELVPGNTPTVCVNACSGSSERVFSEPTFPKHENCVMMYQDAVDTTSVPNPSCNSSSSEPTFLDSENMPILPPKVKKRGRPKGHDKTVIGLLAKKKRGRVRDVARGGQASHVSCRMRRGAKKEITSQISDF